MMTKIKTFEEKFPELIKHCPYHAVKGNGWFTKKEVNTCCLDKQRVKEAIDEVISQDYPQGILLNNELKQRLKL